MIFPKITLSKDGMRFMVIPWLDWWLSPNDWEINPCDSTECTYPQIVHRILYIYIHISQYLYIYIYMCLWSYIYIYIYCIPKIHCCIKYRYGPYGCVWKYGIPNSNGFIILFPSFTDRPFSGDSPSSDRPIDTSSSANHLWHQEYIPYVIYQVIIRIYPVRALKLRQKKKHLYF